LTLCEYFSEHGYGSAATCVVLKNNFLLRAHCYYATIYRIDTDGYDFLIYIMQSIS